jgi:transposase
MLFPPNLNDWLPKNHSARYVVDFVETLDLSKFYALYGGSGEGQPPYDPKMMLAILLYGNMRGICSSRKLECALSDDIGMRFITGGLSPDHDTIANFRALHHASLKDVFIACVRLALRGGVVALNQVAIDGTKMRSNTSRNALRSSTRLNEEIETVKSYVGNYLSELEKADREEDARFGKERNGYLLPSNLTDEQQRKSWIKAGLEELDEEGQPQENNDDDDDDDSDSDGKINAGTGTSVHGSAAKKRLTRKLRKLEKAKKALDEKEKKRKEEDPTGKRERDADRKRGKPYEAKVNITDPDSRTMLFPGGSYQEGFNGQIVVDNEAGIIVAAELTQDANDIRQLSPLLVQTQENTEWLPDCVCGDTGYFNVDQMEEPKFKNVDFYIVPRGRGKKESATSKSELMREKLETEKGKAIYSKRKSIVEPVFAAIKHARKFRQFLTRGLDMAKCEWFLCCITHNLLKMQRLGVTPT